jgi:hypothetical protein
VTGHRIGLQDLVYFYKEGHSAEALVEMFPTLTLAQIHKLIAFYLEHQVELDAYEVSSKAEIARHRATTTRGRTWPSSPAGYLLSKRRGHNHGAPHRAIPPPRDEGNIVTGRRARVSVSGPVGAGLGPWGEGLGPARS